MDTTPITEIRKRLEQEHATLAARLRQIGAGPDDLALGLAEGDRGLDLFDQVQASESRESHFASKDRIVSRLRRVAAALERFRDGTFGHCVECGEAIAIGRLRAIPEVSTCVACQERLERSAAGARFARPVGVRAILDDVESDAFERAEPSVVSLAGVGAVQSTTEVLESLREHAMPEMVGAHGEDGDEGAGNGGARRPTHRAGGRRHGAARGHSRRAHTAPARARRPVMEVAG